jgi:hypothetical protein
MNARKLAEKEIQSVKKSSFTTPCEDRHCTMLKIILIVQCILLSCQVFPVQVDPDGDENVHMFFARGERWRRLRSIVNPAFSSTKMRTVNILTFEYFYHQYALHR